MPPNMTQNSQASFDLESLKPISSKLLRKKEQHARIVQQTDDEWYRACIRERFSCPTNSQASFDLKSLNPRSRKTFKKKEKHARIMQQTDDEWLRACIRWRLECPPQSSYVALDCEMVGVGPGGHTSSLAQVTIIDWAGKVLFNEYIFQTQPVTDYRTFVSGITRENLRRGKFFQYEIQTMVRRFLEGKIIVGHALDNDLEAMGIQHPWWMIRDTAKFEPFMQLRGGSLCPRKLKDLARQQLFQIIQKEGEPHSPYRDAISALDVYRTVRFQWEYQVHHEIRQQQEQWQPLYVQHEPGWYSEREQQQNSAQQCTWKFLGQENAPGFMDYLKPFEERRT